MIRPLFSRALLLPLPLLFAAAPAFAQASSCAALPETGRVAAPAPDRSVAPVPNADRSLRCPDDFTLNALARPPKCTAPGIKPVEGSPRSACYAALPLGPLADLAPPSRPTRSCETRTTTTILRLTGRNVGLADAVLTITPPAGITATTLTAAGTDVPVDADPVLQSCFAHQCRLVKLDITAKAAPQVAVTLAFPGQQSVTTTLKLPEYCPR